MLYEIIEKTNEWKLGDGWLRKAWLKQGGSAEEVQKLLDESRDLRGWEYNRGIAVAAATFATVYFVIPFAKDKINEIKTKRKLKKIQKKMVRDLKTEESEEEAE